MIYPLLPCNVCNDGTPEWVGRPSDPNFCKCPGCGCKREQDYGAKGVQLDASALSEWHGDKGYSLAEDMLPCQAKEYAPHYAAEGGAEVANCINTKTGEVCFKNRKQAKKYRETRVKLEKKGIIPV